MARGYDLRPNMKAKANSQGTLFQGGTDQMAPERRYPRGYTPRRMWEIRQRVPVAVERFGEGQGPGMRNPFTTSESGKPLPSELSRRLVHETLARSSFSGRQLRGLARVRLSPGISEFGSSTRGYYNTATREISLFARGETGSGPTTDLDQSEATLVHEAGHHVDVMHNPRAALLMENASHTRGEMEANADKHMVENFRPHPSRPWMDAHHLTYGQRLGTNNILGATGYTDPSKYAQPKASPQRRAIQGELF